MTLTHTREQAPANERTAVRVVDSDVHPVPKQGVLTDYIPEPWRSKHVMNHQVGNQIDDPRWLVKHLPEHAREAIMFRNGIETYKLPETVAALDGQVRAF